MVTGGAQAAHQSSAKRHTVMPRPSGRLPMQEANCIHRSHLNAWRHFVPSAPRKDWRKSMFSPSTNFTHHKLAVLQLLVFCSLRNLFPEFSHLSLPRLKPRLPLCIQLAVVVLDLQKDTLIVEEALHNTLLREPAFVHHLVHLHALRIAFQPQTAFHELVHSHSATSVLIQELEEGPGILYVNLQGLQEGDHFLVLEVLLELSESDFTILGSVPFSE
mmetsp:Transcript_28784/g.66919  ORF Transcript_28784/g.66919 Transcript_28784/m.66919 type:complete len:217 (-) Transcript_28784:2142-2792(-)